MAQGSAEYRVLVVERDGTLIAELQNAQLQTVRWALNEPGVCRFALPFTDAKNRSLDLLTTEIQVWRKGSLLWWGVLTRARSNLDLVIYEARGLLWYFTRRNVGKPDRTNYITNPSYETDAAGVGVPTGWAQGGAINVDTVETAASAGAQLGSKVLRLTHSTPVVDVPENVHLRQRYTGAEAVAGRIFTLAAWYKIVTWFYEPFGKRGLMIDVRDPTVMDGGGNPKSLAQVTFPINAKTPRGRWQRAEVQVLAPDPASGTAVVVEARVYALNGVIEWDAVTLTRNEALLPLEADMADVAEALVDHAQDTAYGKSDLSIGTSCPSTGVTISRPYRHAEHANIAEALADLCDQDDGIDVDVTYTATARTFRTYYPRKGSYKPDYTLEVGRNVAIVEWDEDGESVVNSAVVLGDGDGSDREEGGYRDASGLGGLVLEEVVQAPRGSRIRSLDKRARELVRTRGTIAQSGRVRTFDRSGLTMIGNLEVGDTVPVRIDAGRLDVSADYRIVEVTLDPARDELDLTLNPA